jgi:hypothetical protein
MLADGFQRFVLEQALNLGLALSVSFDTLTRSGQRYMVMGKSVTCPYVCGRNRTRTYDLCDVNAML